jgi:hypothetical protein
MFSNIIQFNNFFNAIIFSKINLLFIKYNFLLLVFQKNIILVLLFQYSKKSLGTFLTNSRVYHLLSKRISGYILFIF